MAAEIIVSQEATKKRINKRTEYINIEILPSPRARPLIKLNVSMGFTPEG